MINIAIYKYNEGLFAQFLESLESFECERGEPRSSRGLAEAEKLREGMRKERRESERCSFVEQGREKEFCPDP